MDNSNNNPTPINNIPPDQTTATSPTPAPSDPINIDTSLQPDTSGTMPEAAFTPTPVATEPSNSSQVQNNDASTSSITDTNLTIDHSSVNLPQSTPGAPNPLISSPEPTVISPSNHPEVPVVNPVVTGVADGVPPLTNPSPVTETPAVSVASNVSAVESTPETVNQPSSTTTEPTPATPPAPSTPSGSIKKILLVEDDEGLASVYKTRLTAEGFDIKHVANGEDALSAAVSYKPDLVLLDVMMPKVSGFDVLDILRNTPETTNVKIIMLTALSQEADKQRAEGLGVDEYLVKSQVVISEVVDRIKKHLNL